MDGTYKTFIKTEYTYVAYCQIARKQKLKQYPRENILDHPQKQD